MEKPRADTDSGESVSCDEEPFAGQSAPQKERPWSTRDIYIGWTPNGYLKVGRHVYRGWPDFVGSVLAMATALVFGLIVMWFIDSCQTGDYSPFLDPPKYENEW